MPGTIDNSQHPLGETTLFVVFSAPVFFTLYRIIMYTHDNTLEYYLLSGTQSIIESHLEVLQEGRTKNQYLNPGVTGPLLVVILNGGVSPSNV